jgi:REP element-mobilizing transposase RayT
MVTRSFLKAHADAVENIRAMLEDDPLCPPELAEVIRIVDEDDEDEDHRDQDAEDEDEDEEETPWSQVEYYHVTSRIHLGRFLLEKNCVKEILAKECLHYARVCEIEILHHSIMDNHFHLFVGVQTYSLSLSKMMGCIKQQFTNKFKAWFNDVYRKENRYRKKALTNGSLWEGRCKYERIKDAVQFAACSLYIDNNRIVVEAKRDIGMLDEPPSFQPPEEVEDYNPDRSSSDWEPLIGPLQPCYEELLDKVRGFAFHSAPYYLGACKAHQTYLTDG